VGVTADVLALPSGSGAGGNLDHVGEAHHGDNQHNQGNDLQHLGSFHPGGAMPVPIIIRRGWGYRFPDR
jgi:hypothetical protein